MMTAQWRLSGDLAAGMGAVNPQGTVIEALIIFDFVFQYEERGSNQSKVSPLRFRSTKTFQIREFQELFIVHIAFSPSTRSKVRCPVT